MQAEHEGRTWQKDPQGTITWWDGEQWVWWDPNVAGPRPPQQFFGSPATGGGSRFLPRWRPFTWVIVIINILFLIWVIGGIAASGDSCAGLVGDELDICEAGTAVGTGIGIGIIVFFWGFVDIILGVIWLVTRSGRRPCPVCGSDVKKGQTICKKCGHNFAIATPGHQGPANWR